MTDGEAVPDRPVSYRTNRLEAFSDGVFAIAITPLVLEISVPPGSENDSYEPSSTSGPHTSRTS